MVNALFEELLASIQEAGQIRRGEKPASRTFHYNPLDIKAIRQKTGCSQNRFAKLMGISLRTYQNWEQGHRHPTGPALALLAILDQDPKYALSILDRSSRKHSIFQISQQGSE